MLFCGAFVFSMLCVMLNAAFVIPMVSMPRIYNKYKRERKNAFPLNGYDSAVYSSESILYWLWAGGYSEAGQF